MLDRFLIEDTLKRALVEDMNNGDITTEYLIDDSSEGEALVTAKQCGVICGLEVSKTVFEIVDSELKFSALTNDGDYVSKGSDVLKVEGKIKNILKSERVALNFLQRMSGIATKAYDIVKIVEGIDVRVVDTRKTTPGLRIFEKYAVTTGGAFNHRFNLTDAVMIKDNHIEAVGSITEAIRLSRRHIPHTAKIEIEVKNIEELREALESGADIIMLDNMNESEMKQAVEITDKRVILEASGNITEKNLRQVAETGVDVISIGALTHSYTSMDLSLNIKIKE